MPEFEPTEHTRRCVVTTQIIAGALMAGVLMFFAMTLIITANRGDVKQKDEPLLAYIGAGGAVLMLAASMTIPGLVVSSQRRQIAQGTWQPPPQNAPAAAVPATDTERLLAVFQTQWIIGGALLEGAAFLNLVAFIVDGQWWSLAIALGLVCVMGLRFPTQNRVYEWVREQLRRIEDEKSFQR